MIFNAKIIKGYKLNGLDGEIGGIKEFYFDDRFWAIRYLVAETGSWFTNKKVLISPYSLLSIDRNLQHININLTKEKIKNCPSVDSDKPVSRQYEESYNNYYGWPSYWGGSHMWGEYPRIKNDGNKISNFVHIEKGCDPYLRSTKEVCNYHIKAIDGDIGHVDDFIVDDETWAIRYLIVDTQNWIPGKKILISPRWIDSFNWNQSSVSVKLTKEIISQAPEYSEELQINREYEHKLHGHYNRKGYWVEGKSDDVEFAMSTQTNEENYGKVLAVYVSGKLTKEDYDKFLPEMEKLINIHGKLRVLFVMTNFAGWELSALWEDIKFDIKHFGDIERVAMVGEKKWQKELSLFCVPFAKAVVRYFDHSEASEARIWLNTK